ncbi:hypothetical protein ACF0H5_009761 [Mactra antiquata]
MAKSVRLQPESILNVAIDTEARVWTQGGITDGREESLREDSENPGMCLLQHSTSAKTIHNYFMGLEQRKCCLLLAACKQRFSSVRLVHNDGRDSGIEEGAMMKSSIGSIETVPCLDAVEFQVFQLALKCAAFPVLGAPDPPSEASPVPTVSLGYKRKDGVQLLQAITPLSMVDSGVDEQHEDTAMVPAETLCELLQRSFRLTPEKFRQYEDIIAGQLEKKSPQKILAEELVRQLIALENNENPFYHPAKFLNRNGYDQWQQRERTSISELLGKFWHFSLPQISDRSIKMSSLHKQYVKLMEKLISYESPYRQQNELIAPPPTSSLSSASVRLLKEFGLRYGVGEQYRKIVYLNYLSLNFDPTVWFTHHVMSSLTLVMDCMPTKRSCLMIVKEEYSILEHSLHLLEAKISAAIAKMKTLFSNKRAQDGVESLIKLLSVTLQAKSYLLMIPEEKLGNRLFKIVETIFPTAYERHKMVAQDELRHNKWNTELSPKLLNMMIGSIRDEVLEYKQYYQHSFQRYFNITVEAAQEFYKLLMADVKELLKQTKDKNVVLEINRLMLGLTYRLNQLDHDWSVYITPQMQTWRDVILVEAQHWGVMLKLDMQKLITLIVPMDKYPECEIEYHGILQSPGAPRDTRERTVSKSLTPSFNSAFTSLSSYNPSVDNKPMNQQKTKAKDFEQEGLSGMAYLDRRPSSDPVNISKSSMLSGSYLGDVARSIDNYNHERLLTFTHLRQSSSLPDFGTKEKYIEMLPTSFNGDLSHMKRNIGRKQPKGNDKHTLEQGKSVSPEICQFTSDNPRTNPTDSDESGTLTDESNCGDFNFPPLQEVMTSPSISSPDQAPVIALSNVPNTHTIIQPVAQRSLSTNDRSHTSGSINRHALAATSLIKSGTKEKGEPSGFQSVNHDKPIKPLNTRISVLKGHGVSFKNNQGYENSGSNSFLLSSIPHPLPTQQSTYQVVPVSSSSMDVVIILQRLVGFGKVLCRTLFPGNLSCDSDQSTFVSSHEEDVLGAQVYNKSRQKLYDCFLSAVKQTIIVYIDNMLCLDLCGLTQAMASRLAGSRLVEYLRTQQQSGLVWGCRHDLNNTDCFEYLNKKTSLLCDRHEQITRQMCSRINNVYMMLSCLDWYHHYLGNIFGIHSDIALRKNNKYFQSSFSSVDIIKNEFIVVDGYQYDPSYDRSEVMETASQLCPSQLSGDGKMMVTSPIDSDKDHIMAVLRTLCRIMAYRLNMFVCDALPVLLTLKGSDVPIETGLQPITDFLSRYFISLQEWMYEEPYQRMLECLWIFIVQDFEIELRKIERSEEETEFRGQLQLQALAHLLKFMNNQHERLRRELLLSQADDVSFKLSLYAMPLTQLIAIYDGLNRNIGTGSEVSSTDAQYQSVLLVRQRLKNDLQTMKKGFSGAELLQWILNNQALFSSFDSALSESNGAITTETANVIAQRFLDWNLIADVEGETVRGRSTPMGSLDEYQFPAMTIHDEDQLPPGDRIVSSNESSPLNSHRNSPRPVTPRRNLKSSLRALSRQSRQTPASRLADKSYFNTSARPARNDLDRGQFQGERFNVSSRSGRGEYDQGQFQNEAAEQKEALQGNVQSQTGVTNVDVDKSKQVKLNNEEADNNLEATVQDSDATERLNSISSMESEGPSTMNTNSFSFNSQTERASPGFDPYLFRGTPLSLTSAMSCDSRNALFFGDRDNFYYVCPYIGDDQELTWKNCELFHLVEECFQKKITAQYIMRIIYSRRKYDPNARAFLKKSPTEMIQKLRFGMPQEDVPRCVSS